LHALIEAEIAAEDAAVSDQYELFSRAKGAVALGQWQRARKLATQAFEQDPGNPGRAASFCSILRQIGSPAEALAIADRFSTSTYTPILTSRSAALCDLGRLEEASRQILHVLSLKPGDELALLVLGRIKSYAPHLFENI
jgi:tetratricopeptide (TPR) repeat protein